MIDEDVLISLKRIAKEKGTRYQTLLNEILRQYVSTSQKGDEPLTEARVREIVRDEVYGANHPRPLQSE